MQARHRCMRPGGAWVEGMAPPWRINRAAVIGHLYRTFKCVCAGHTQCGPPCHSLCRVGVMRNPACNLSLLVSLGLPENVVEAWAG